MVPYILRRAADPSWMLDRATQQMQPRELAFGCPLYAVGGSTLGAARSYAEIADEAAAAADLSRAGAQVPRVHLGTARRLIPGKI